MSNPTEIYPRTSIAAISFTRGGKAQRRVYFQDLNGAIRESRFDGQNWSGGTSGSDDIVVQANQAKLGTSIAAIHLDYKDAIHVFYLTNDNIIREIRQDHGGDWFSSQFNDHVYPASPASRLTVIGYTRYIHTTSLYYQRPDGVLGEIRRDGDYWVEGANVGNTALTGTGLAALTFHGTDSEGVFTGIRLYYQLPNGTVTDAGIDRGKEWYKQGTLKLENAPPNASLSTLSVGTAENPMFQLYFINKHNWISEGGYYSGEWHFENHPGETIAAPGGGVSVMLDNGLLRLYVQDETNEIVEYSSAKAYTGWTREGPIPTGPVQ